jgi:hypothetical protein
MNEQDFIDRTEDLLRQRATDQLFALDLGRRFRELCNEYLRSNSQLPKGFEAFE